MEMLKPGWLSQKLNPESDLKSHNLFRQALVGFVFIDGGRNCCYRSQLLFVTMLLGAFRYPFWSPRCAKCSTKWRNGRKHFYQELLVAMEKAGFGGTSGDPLYLSNYDHPVMILGKESNLGIGLQILSKCQHITAVGCGYNPFHFSSAVRWPPSNLSSFFRHNSSKVPPSVPNWFPSIKPTISAYLILPSTTPFSSDCSSPLLRLFTPTLSTVSVVVTVHLVAMAGSKGGKHSKGKGKPRSNKSKANQKKPEAYYSNLDQAQIPNQAHATETSKETNLNSQTTEKTCYTESELEDFLYLKLKYTYTTAKYWLLSTGYDLKVIERAILNGGHFHGPVEELMNNILTSAVAFIEQQVEANGDSFKDASELYKTMLESLVDLVMHAEPHLQFPRTDAMWHLLVRNWGSVPSTTALDSSFAAEEASSELDMASSSKKVRLLERINFSPALMSLLRQNFPILVTSILEKIGASVIEQHEFEDDITEGSDIMGLDFLKFIEEEYLNLSRCLENHPHDPRSAVIVDLMINIKNLQEKVNVEKEWAQRKVTDSAKRLSKNLLETRILKMEKVDAEYYKGEMLSFEQSCMLTLREAELSLRNVNSEIRFIDETVRDLEIDNTEIRADTEALKLGVSEYEDNLNQVLNKERKFKKKVSNIEKQTKNFRAQCDEEMQMVLQLQLEGSQAEKETVESVGKWRQEIQNKTHMLALLAEEARETEKRKANSKALLMRLGQELNVKNQLKKDKHQKLEDELSRLHLSHQSPNISLDGDRFPYNGVRVTPLEPNVLYESSSCHRKCIFCLDNDVRVLLLPCTHQVSCAFCYEEICNTVNGCCPYCHAQIQQAINVFWL